MGRASGFRDPCEVFLIPAPRVGKPARGRPGSSPLLTIAFAHQHQRDGELLRACSARKKATARQRPRRDPTAPFGHSQSRHRRELRHPCQHEGRSGPALEASLANRQLRGAPSAANAQVNRNVANNRSAAGSPGAWREFGQRFGSETVATDGTHTANGASTGFPRRRCAICVGTVSRAGATGPDLPPPTVNVQELRVKNRGDSTPRPIPIIQAAIPPTPPSALNPCKRVGSNRGARI